MSDLISKQCPQCGAVRQENGPGGLCPNCLMALNLKTETTLTHEGKTTEPPLPAEEAAPHFPQLEILECLGRGGMGVVYKARQKALNRLVALKLLAPERVRDAKFAEWFAREAQALASLSHPNIVTIYDFGQAGGFYFLLMEYVDGLNLRQLLRSRRLSPEEALAIVPPICDALQFAHDHGIVHRDIKPENLLLDKSGRVKIADFGIAKILGAGVGASAAQSLGAVEGTTSGAGTPGYSAPEQSSDPQRVDSRADIFSLGVVFYEMLTGELPGTKLQPPSRKVQIDVRLDEVVLRALEKMPDLRYQTALEFRSQVEEAGKKTPETLENLRAGLAPGFPSTGFTAAGLTIVWWCAGFLVLLVCLKGRVVVAAVFMAIAAIFQANLAIRLSERWRTDLDSSSGRRWLKAFSCLGWTLAVPTVGLGVSFVTNLLSERGRWNPAISEAVGVPIIWMASLLLPVSSYVLWRAAQLFGPGTLTKATPQVNQGHLARILFRVAGGLSIVLVACLIFIRQAKRRSIETAVAQRSLALNRAARGNESDPAPVVPAEFAERIFPLRHKLASEMVEDLRQILLGRPGYEAKPSTDNQELLVTAPPEVLGRVETFVTVNDWPDRIELNPRGTVLHTARSFFNACAVEAPWDEVSKLLSPGVLAKLKGETDNDSYKSYLYGGVLDPQWEKSLRADWPGKKEAIERMMREWSRYPLKRVTEDPGIAIGFGVKHFCSLSFEGAPKEFYQITIEPDRAHASTDSESAFCFGSLPPWSKVTY